MTIAVKKRFSFRIFIEFASLGRSFHKIDLIAFHYGITPFEYYHSSYGSP